MPRIPAWRIRLRTLLGLILAVGLVLGLVAEGERRARVRAALEWPMLEAAERGETDRISAMLDRGADVDSITEGYGLSPRDYANGKRPEDIETETEPALAKEPEKNG